MLHLGFMSFFMIKYLIVLFNPNDPKRDAFKEMSYLDHLAKLFRDPLIEHCLFPIEIVIIPSPRTPQSSCMIQVVHRHTRLA